jgi:hypothetical protein
MSTPTQNPLIAAMAADAQAQQAILSQGVPSSQRIFSSSGINPATTPNVQIDIKKVGVITGFLVRVSGTVTAAAGAALTLTALGAYNILDRVKLTDFSNQTRINVKGRNLAVLNAKRHGRWLGMASNSYYNANGAQFPESSVWDLVDGQATIAGAGTGTVTAWYFVPCAYDDNDLRGALFGQVSGVSASIELDFNSNIAGTDTVNGAYTSAGAAGALSNVSVDVWQYFINNLPMQNGQYVYANLAFQSLYEIKDQTLGQQLSAGSETLFDLSNARQYSSIGLVYNNNNTLNVGTDVSKIRVVAQSVTTIKEWTPASLQLEARMQMHGCDSPAGHYFLSFRRRPISVAVYGNTQIGFTPSAVTAGATLEALTETMTPAANLSLAGPLAG